MVNWMRVGAACLAMATVAASAGAAVLVVRSSGPSAGSFPPGKALADSTAIRLKPNDMVVLLDSRGTRTLRGPGTFSASASAAAHGSALSAVTAGGSSKRVRVGAVRGGPTGATQGRNVWQADVARSGAVCVANPDDLGLYRSNNGSEAHVTLTNEAGKSATVEFEPGQSIASWPDELPVASGQKVRVKGAGSQATLNLKLITPVPAGLEGMAQIFIRNDCQAQLDVLIDTFTSPSAS